MSRYIITGIDVYQKRFRKTTDNYMYAMNINLYNGSVWESTPLEDVSKRLIKRAKEGTVTYREC